MDMPVRGVYMLVMQLQRETKLTVGRLGTFNFSQGYYVYIGSALSGFAGRINRHLRRKKKFRWHIDYLLDVADILWVELFETESHEDECKLNASVCKFPGAEVVAPGFGSSDCKCGTHLYYFKDLPSERPKL